jgi:5,10-methylenetetrahydrofolate reductase
MKISSILAKAQPSVSFEVFPPRSTALPIARLKEGKRRIEKVTPL